MKIYLIDCLNQDAHKKVHKHIPADWETINITESELDNILKQDNFSEEFIVCFYGSVITKTWYNNLLSWRSHNAFWRTAFVVGDSKNPLGSPIIIANGRPIECNYVYFPEGVNHIAQYSGSLQEQAIQFYKVKSKKNVIIMGADLDFYEKKSLMQGVKKLDVVVEANVNAKVETEAEPEAEPEFDVTPETDAWWLNVPALPEVPKTKAKTTKTPKTKTPKTL